jgi:tetratricopeptide (TPR) repeat protein
MPELTPEELADAALAKLRDEDPRGARELLLRAVEAAPDRVDLLNALGVVHLQLGEPELAIRLIEEAVSRVDALVAKRPAERDHLTTMRDGFRLSLAAAHEDLDQPDAAAREYRHVLADSPGQPRARQGLAHLLLARGDLAAGLEELRTYVRENLDEDAFIEGAGAYAEEVDGFVKRNIQPREFLVAHRESYVEMFDHYEAEQAAEGWIAEAARMMRAPDGKVVPLIPEGARPYAAVRVDLVNPQTSQVGQVGDQPMVVALAEFQTLARAPVLFPVGGLPFSLHISSQSPWDQLPISMRFERRDSVEAVDGLIGDWYHSGYEGAFGTRDAQRFHYVSDPDVKRDGFGVTYTVDLGRARVEGLDDLLRRLVGFHASHPLRALIVGRGYLP